jgi:PHS family inorganic phosphate transporter-like MFS transporter
LARPVAEIPSPVPPKGPPENGRALLAELDGTGVGRFHLRTIVVAGMGFFTDAYDLFVISLVIPILSGLNGGLSTSTTGLLGASALIGAAVGQVIFGFLGDRVGRKRTYAITLGVMAIGAVGSALSGPFAGLGGITVLMLWRFVLGVGVGGDYPLSATIMSEYSNVRHRGSLVATVFAMQGFGLLAGAAATLAAVYLLPLSLAWRVVLAGGAVPALFTIYYRTKIGETPRFSLSKGNLDAAARAVGDVTGGVQGPAAAASRRPAPSRSNGSGPAIPFWRMLRTYALLVFGTASAWFLLDMAFYSTNIFNPTVLTYVGFAGTPGLAIVAKVRLLAIGNVLIALFASVPGYWVAVALIDRLGRKPLQSIGFGVMTVSFLVLSFAYAPLKTFVPAFLVIYGTTFFFANFGPNTTTFVYPSEVFPTAFRTTGHGIAAAAGKTGAVIAVFLFPLLISSYGPPFVFGLLSIFCFGGLLVTLAFLPETSQRTLEDISGEDELAVLVRRFSTHLQGLSQLVVEAARGLEELLADPDKCTVARVAHLRALEHAADEEVHRIYIELNHHKLSGEVRAEVGKLASSLDDIMDGIESVSARVETYRLADTSDELARFARIVTESSEHVGEGIVALDELYHGRTEALDRAIVEVNRLENEADDLLRVLLARLFEGRDPVEILKWKDFYERLELITDRCEDVTDIFQDLEVRYAPAA